MSMIAHLQSLLAGVARFGQGAGGVCRAGFSTADQECRRWFAGQMRSAGLDVRQDAFGNLFGRLEGAEPALPAIATGSHLDTVPNGGNYDGVLGCAAGLAAIADIARSGGTKRSLELIIFQIEESTRFACSTMGSKILCGRLDLTNLQNFVDANGVSVAQAMTAAGLAVDLEALRACACDPSSYGAFVELHIDQGPVLEEAGVPLGVVSGIVGVRRARVYFHGRALHAGATPMHARKNALLSAARAALALDRIAVDKKGQDGMVATAGNLMVEPGAINVVPAKAMLHCEMRAGSEDLLQIAWGEFERQVGEIAETWGTPAEIVVTENIAPVHMDQNIQNVLGRAALARGATFVEMYSGAGHDCMNMAAIMPAGMLFVRGRGGVSHHPDEFARPQDAALGCQVLRDSLLELANA